MLSGECSICRRIYADASLGCSSWGCSFQASLESILDNNSSVLGSSWHKVRNLESRCNACTTASRNTSAHTFAFLHSNLLSRLGNSNNYILGRRSGLMIFLEAIFAGNNRVSGPYVKKNAHCACSLLVFLCVFIQLVCS